MIQKALLFLSLGAVSFAAPTIATVSSLQPISLDGHLLTGVNINSWPLVSGDTLATSEMPATLSFKDGSTVMLAKGSGAILSGSLTEPKLILTGGSLDYKIAPGSNLVISKKLDDSAKAAQPVALKRTARSSFIGSPVAYASIAGAAAVGATTFALNSGSPAMSGSIATPTSLATAPLQKAHTTGTACPAGPGQAPTQQQYGFTVSADPYLNNLVTCWDSATNTISTTITIGLLKYPAVCQTPANTLYGVTWWSTKGVTEGKIGTCLPGTTVQTSLIPIL